ncbi:MAG: hypothetical protein C0519_12455 [Hyphomicrobium sp.]|jgi:hypothetical protein|nr:hypothetical protein [Hyphomicrobium sp.]PPD07825.1 MAG: hypothetical protein CTY28_08325 [Hyphomicrobium sp.]
MNPIPQPPFPELVLPWWVDVLFWAPAIIVVVYMVWIWRKAYSATGILSKQTAYLDHQKSANDQALAQNKAMEDLIAKQYAENNRRADEALAQSAEALRLHAASLEQLTAMNATLAQLAARGIAGKPA